jgi:cytoskeleton protein RodZ
LTFFQRIKTPFTESPAEEQARVQPRMRLIGELLQERREDLGLDLDEIGAMLRIKPLYLAALEQGRTHDLPGPTYAIGFVRAYSDFLGLDAEAVLARFKTEAAGVTARPDLALPVPLGERSLPGGALVLVALIVALCGYGIWYYMSTEARNRPERVAAVPAALDKPSTSLVAPPAQPASVQPVSLYGAAAGASPASGPASASGSPPVASPPAAQAATPQGTAQTSQQSAPVANLAPGALITTMPRNVSPGVPAPAAPPSQQQAQQAAPPASAPAPAPATVAPAQQAASVTAATPASAQSTPATPGAGGKITIKAVTDCWIQVRATDQSIVFSRVLKAGETYAVPQRTGLSLRTGNAGALEIAVDGKTVPSIGGIGALRRDVELDSTELAAGTAVHG